jgi:hypothetical protein
MQNHSSVMSDVESPFLNDISLPSAVPVAVSRADPTPIVQSLESPFIAEYHGEADFIPAAAEEFASLMSDLYDPEFEEALEDLVNEAAAVADGRMAFELGDPTRHRADTERAVRDYLAPLEQAMEGSVSAVAAALAHTDLKTATDAEIDALFDQVKRQDPSMPPVFEHALGGFLRKAKAVLNKVKNTVGKVLPHHLILRKLAALVRPLLNRVLRFAIDKLPVAVRPVASQLAKRLLKIGETADLEDEKTEEASLDTSAIQEELDARIAGLVIGGEDFERHATIEGVVGEETARERDALGELERARARFARRVSTMNAGDDPSPAVEEFAPAILGAAKLAIGVIGRPRVVAYLANLIAKLISKYVGQSQAAMLSRALVDAGLRMVSLEAAGSDEATAGYALASTVEDTINRLVQTAPEHAWESEPVLEAYALDAFQRAAAAHFPDVLIREEFHEAAQSSGAWIALPVNTPQKRYKKYSRVLNVKVTPQTAAAVLTFGGTTLRDFLKDRLGVRAGGPVAARAHLYEAIPGTRLSLVAFHEKGVPGLGSAGRAGRSLFHPLTREAAGLLFNEPGLGHSRVRRTGSQRRALAVGERFYFLEVPGAVVRLVRASTRTGLQPARSTHPRVAVDLLKRELRVALFFSESEAQELAAQLRRRMAPAALLSALKARHATQLLQLMTGQRSDALRVINGAAPLPTAALAALQPILRSAGDRIGAALQNWMLQALDREIRDRHDRFVKAVEEATAADVDGATITVVLRVPAVFDALRKLLAGGAAAITAVPRLLAALANPGALDPDIHVKPGLVQP